MNLTNFSQIHRLYPAGRGRGKLLPATRQSARHRGGL